MCQLAECLAPRWRCVVNCCIEGGIKDWSGNTDLGIVSKTPEYKILVQNYPSSRNDLSYIQVHTYKVSYIMGHAFNYCLLNNKTLCGGNSFTWNNFNQWSFRYSWRSLGRIRKKWRQRHYTQIQSLLLGGMDLTIPSIICWSKSFKKKIPWRTVQEVFSYVVGITNTYLPDDLFLFYAT